MSNPVRTLLVTATRAGRLATVIIRRGPSGTGGGGATDVGDAIAAADAKNQPADADKFGFLDSVSDLLKSITWAQLKAALKTYFDTVYTWANLGGKPTTFPPTIGSGAADAVAGNDARLNNARPASDVYSWAKAIAKPGYTAGEVGAVPIDGSGNAVAAGYMFPDAALASYTSGGFTWFDNNFTITTDLATLTANRTISWRDMSGTVAFLADIPTLSGLGGVPTSRTIAGVDLSANRSLADLGSAAAAPAKVARAISILGL